MPETIINLCDYEVVLHQHDGPVIRFPAKVEAPVACMLAATLPQNGSLISKVHWSETNPRVLPPMEDGIFYIVPLEFGHACPRADLLVPFRGQFDSNCPSAFAHVLNTRALVKVREALPPPHIHKSLLMDLDKTLGDAS